MRKVYYHRYAPQVNYRKVRIVFDKTRNRVNAVRTFVNTPVSQHAANAAKAAGRGIVNAAKDKIGGERHSSAHEVDVEEETIVVVRPGRHKREQSKAPVKISAAERKKMVKMWGAILEALRGIKGQPKKDLEKDHEWFQLRYSGREKVLTIHCLGRGTDKRTADLVNSACEEGQTALERLRVESWRIEGVNVVVEFKK